MALVTTVLALVLPVSAVVPAYPGARSEAAPQVRLQADGARVVVSRLATRDALRDVRRRLTGELGAGRVLSDVDDGQRAVLVVGPELGKPTVVAWRDSGEAETHLLLERRLGVGVPVPPLEATPSGSPAGTSTGPVAGAIPVPSASVLGLPLYPMAVPEVERHPVAGGRPPASTTYTTNQPYVAVTTFYRALVPGAALSASAGGTEWLEITSTEPGNPSVQILHEAGSRQTRITFLPHAPQH